MNEDLVDCYQRLRHKLFFTKLRYIPKNVTKQKVETRNSKRSLYCISIFTQYREMGDILVSMFEEKIDEMLQNKKELANLTVASGEKWIGELSNSELNEIFRLRQH
ncbi:MAG: hypothetical protein NT004_07560 [Bacteroidetes bacterium]|nr:hypothetical protein [Bacteroidota bacterium]